MPVITVEQFRDGLMMFPGAVILTIRSRINPFDNKKMLLRGNPYRGRVHYVVTANGTIGADYEAAVNRARALRGWETDFVAGPHPWAEEVNRHFVYHPGKDRWYIKFIQKSRKERWYLDGRIVPKAVFAEWLKPDRDEEVVYRNFAIDKFCLIRHGGQTFRFHAEPARV